MVEKVYSAVRTDSLYKAYTFSLQKDNVSLTQSVRQYTFQYEHLNHIMGQLAKLNAYVDGPGLSPCLKTRLYDLPSLQNQSRHLRHTDMSFV